MGRVNFFGKVSKQLTGGQNMELVQDSAPTAFEKEAALRAELDRLRKIEELFGEMIDMIAEDAESNGTKNTDECYGSIILSPVRNSFWQRAQELRHPKNSSWTKQEFAPQSKPSPTPAETCEEAVA